MKKGKWLLLITIISGVIAWYFFFHKSYTNKTIAASADMVLAVDVKKNVNTIIGYYIIHPKEWNIASLFRSTPKTDTTFDWKTAIDIPDYLFIFHVKDQPMSVYYSVLIIKNEEAFKKGLQAYGFKQMGNVTSSEYYSTQLGIDLIKNDDRILLAIAPEKNRPFIASVANELFTKKKYITIATLDKIVAPSNCFSIYIQQNNFLQEDAIINGRLSQGSFNMSAAFEPNKQFVFSDNTFNVSDSSLLALCFIQPAQNVYAAIPDSIRTSVSTALNFNVDSVFIPQNKNYTLDIAGIKTRTDVAITYDYDDNFNKIAHTIKNEVQEPSFDCRIAGSDPTKIFRYWERNKNIEKDTVGNLFVSVPFVRSYVYNNDNDSLLITSYNYDKKPTEQLKCIAYLNINTNKLPVNAVKYFPDYLSQLLINIESVKGVLKKENDKIVFELKISNKDKGKPFLFSF